MVFVDMLTDELIALGISGLVIAYMVFNGYRAVKRGSKPNLKAGIAPIALLGLYIFISGLWGQFAWPLPGSYNILFYDPFVLAGILLLSFAWSLGKDLDLRGTGAFAFLLGIFTIYYGYAGYSLGMTTSPIALLGLYSLFGFAGVLGCPVSMMLERMRSGTKRISGASSALLALFLLVVVLGSLLAFFIAGAALPAHLASPP